LLSDEGPLMASESDDRVLCRYGVAFELDGAAATGEMVVTDKGVRLTAGRRGQPVELVIPREELMRVRIGRISAERLNGYSTVVLERRDAPNLLIAPFGFGLLYEIADLLSSLNAPSLPASERIELIVPIKRDSRERIRELVAAGPPFDPAKLGLTRHDVYLEETGVRFSFEGPDARGSVESILSAASLWHAGLAWSRHIDARPHINDQPDQPRPYGELIYSWRC
jgi:hypothetical protein